MTPLAELAVGVAGAALIVAVVVVLAAIGRAFDEVQEE